MVNIVVKSFLIAESVIEGKDDRFSVIEITSKLDAITLPFIVTELSAFLQFTHDSESATTITFDFEIKNGDSTIYAVDIPVQIDTSRLATLVIRCNGLPVAKKDNVVFSLSYNGTQICSESLLVQIKENVA